MYPETEGFIIGVIITAILALITVLPISRCYVRMGEREALNAAIPCDAGTKQEVYISGTGDNLACTFGNWHNQ